MQIVVQVTASEGRLASASCAGLLVRRSTKMECMRIAVSIATALFKIYFDFNLFNFKIYSYIFQSHK